MSVLYFITEEGNNWATMKLTVKKGGDANAVIEWAKKNGWQSVTKKECDVFKEKHAKK
jgi:hypothetical protein